MPSTEAPVANVFRHKRAVPPAGAAAVARGEACDFEIVGMATLELAAWARDNLDDFDPIICECYGPNKGLNSGWVYVSLCLPGLGSNRRQCLSYVPDPTSGRLVYVDGLQAMA
jgi:hypothetical protein